MGLLSMLLNRASFIELILYIISSSIVVFLTMPVHEYAHAYAANRLGDPTARIMGRLSFNPMVHIDYMGALFIYLFGFGWAKPVPVDSRYFNNRKVGMAITAFAGPCANLSVAFIASFLRALFYFLLILSGGSGFIANIIYFLVVIFAYIEGINLSLAVFNLVPIPPLDGSKILAAILPDRLYYKFMQYERFLYIILLFLVFASTGFSNALSKITGFVGTLFDTITWLPFSFFI